jgi:hypothetical protein
MTIRTRLDALEHLLDNLNLADRCPDCLAPHRASPHGRIEAATVRSVCPGCRRLLDHDGLPLGGRCYMLVITDPCAGFPLQYDADRLVWSEDGGPVRIDAGKLTIINRPTADAVL